MVAAWIRALTGVGPSMASGSQTCSGNWADLPAAPAKMPMAAQVKTAPAKSPGNGQAAELNDIEGAGIGIKYQDGGQETEVTQAGHDKGFLGGIGGGRPLEPETDQQIGAEADHFPEDEHHQEIIGQHQSQHGGGKQGHPGIIAMITRVAVHIALGINLDHQADQW